MQPRPAKLAGWLLASATFTISVGIALLISSCRADGANNFLDAIERIESNGNPHAIGDKGKARGPFQFWAVAWSDVSRVRSKRGQSVAHYWCATNRVTARSYAMTYLGMLNTYLTTALKRQPTHTELYAAWNLGPSGFKRRGFSLSRCPASTQKAAARINSMLALSKGGATDAIASKMSVAIQLSTNIDNRTWLIGINSR